VSALAELLIGYKAERFAGKKVSKVTYFCVEWDVKPTIARLVLSFNQPTNQSIDLLCKPWRRAVVLSGREHLVSSSSSSSSSSTDLVAATAAGNDSDDDDVTPTPEFTTNRQTAL